MKNKKGFTLIELLVVIAIIGVLSSLVTVSLSTARQKSRDTQRVENIRQLRAALELYRNANTGYPANLTSLAPAHIPVIPVDPQDTGTGGALCRAGGYCYYLLPNGGYHLGAQLERADAQVLKSDADTNSPDADGAAAGTDFAGTDPVYDVTL